MSTACSSALHRVALAVFYEATRTQQAQAEAKRRAAIKRAQAAFADLFRRQGRLVLERLPRLAKFFLEEAAYDGDLVDAFAEVFDATHAQAEKAMVNSMYEGVNLGYASQAEQFGIESSFKIESKRATAWARENAAERIKQIDDTTQEAIRGVITRGIESGESYGAVAREIRDRFEGFSTQRAETIAVTENAYSYEQGSRSLVDDIQAAGIKMEKQWSTIGGDACEEVCGPNEAQGWISADDDFQSGDAQPPGHPNCRCTCLYQVAEEPAEQPELPSEEIPDLQRPEELPATSDLGQPSAPVEQPELRTIEDTVPSEQAKETLTNYQGEGYKKINSGLRKGTLSGEDESIKAMDGLFSNVGKQDVGKLYRGDGGGVSKALFKEQPLPSGLSLSQYPSDQAIARVNDALSQYKGMTFSDSAFVSTTTEKRVVMEGFMREGLGLSSSSGAQGVMEIRGTAKLIDVESVTGKIVGKGEREMLLQRGSTFRITGAKVAKLPQSKGGGVYIKWLAEVIAP